MRCYVWLNGKLVDEKKAAVPVSDRGFLYGDGVFETMRAYDGTVFRLGRHLGRLAHSLKELGIRPAPSKSFLEKAVYAVLAANRLDGAYIKIIVTRGEGRFGISHRDKFIPNIFISAKPFEGYPAWMHDKGIRAFIAESWTVNEKSPLSRIKSMNFVPYIMARAEAKDKGYDEAILLNTRGLVAEAATSNVFIVKGGTLITPPVISGALPGITREAVIGIAGGAGIKALERPVMPKDLYAADEIFLTNSLAEVLPVASVGKIRMKRAPGPLTVSIGRAYKGLVKAEAARG